MRLSSAPVIAAVAAVALTACAPAEAPPPNSVDGHLVLRGRGTATIAKLEGVRFYGADGEVDQFQDGWRGRWRGEIVDLRADGERITGMVRGQPTDLHVVTEGDTVVIRGIFGGDLGALHVGPNEIDGTVGRKGLHIFRKRGSSFSGVVGGSGEVRAASPVPLVALELPDGFERLPLIERAVWLSLLVGT
jgi:hypothetical protein